MCTYLSQPNEMRNEKKSGKKICKAYEEYYGMQYKE